MEYSSIGKTNIRASRLGAGTWAIGGYGWGKINDDDSIAAIRKAFELGINLFDTSDIYGLGHAEEIIAKALGGRLKEVVVSTKFGLVPDTNGKTKKDASPKHLAEAIDASLRRLKLESIPLYLIHWPDPQTPIEKTMEALLRLQKAGKIGHIGCSNFSLDQIKEAQKYGRVEFVQAPYNIIEREIEGELLGYCRENQMGLFVFSPLMQGLLSGKFNENSRFGRQDIRSRYPNWSGQKLKSNLETVEKIKKIGKKYGKTPAQIAIRWVLENPAVASAMVGITRPEHIIENIGSVGWRLTAEDRGLLAA